MARIRSIHPEACTSATLARLSAEGERTFWRLLTHCDDEGRCEDRPRVLWAALYPEHRDVGPDEVDRDLWELADLGLIVRYEHDGKPLIWVKSWGEFQHPQKPRKSKLAGYDPDSSTVRVPVRDTSGTSTRQVTDWSGVEWSGNRSGEGEGESSSPAVTQQSPAGASTDDRVQAAVRMLAKDDLSRRKFERPDMPIGDEERWLASVERKNGNQHGLTLRAIAGEHPDWSAEQIVWEFWKPAEPEFVGPLPEQLAERKRQVDNMRRLRSVEPDCATCNDDRWVGEDELRPCPTCRPEDARALGEAS